MKYVNPQQLDGMIESIIVDEEKQAKSANVTFTGVSHNKLSSELQRRFGGDWILKKEHPIKFTKQDINAVANARFYKKTGIRILMLWLIVVLALLQSIQWIPIGAIYIYYAICAIVTIGFVYIYGKKQRESRRELWKGIEGDGLEGGN